MHPVDRQKLMMRAFEGGCIEASWYSSRGGFAPAACVAERTCCEIVNRYSAYRFLFHAVDNGFRSGHYRFPINDNGRAGRR
jgi:hypothetical protein